MTTENSGSSNLESEVIASLGQLPKDVLDGLKGLPVNFLCRLCEISTASLDALSRLPVDILSQLSDMSAPTLDWLGNVADSVDAINGEALIRFAHIAKDSPDGLGQIKSVSDETLQILLKLPADVVNSLMSLPQDLLQQLPAILTSVGETLDEIPEELAKTIDEVPIDLMQTLDELNPTVVATLADIDPEAFATLSEIDSSVVETLGSLPPEVLSSLGDIPPGVLTTVLELPGEAVEVISKIDPKVLENTASAQKSSPVVPGELFLKIGRLEDGTGKMWGRMVDKARSLSEIHMQEPTHEEFGTVDNVVETHPEGFDTEGDTDAGEASDDDDSFAETMQSDDWSAEGLSAFGRNDDDNDVDDDESLDGGLETADFSQAIDPEGYSGDDDSDDASMETIQSDFDNASFDHMARETEGAFDGSVGNASDDDDSFAETVQSDEGWSTDGLSAFDQSSQSAESIEDEDDSYGETVQSDSFESGMTLVDGMSGDESFGVSQADDDDDSYGETVQSDSMSMVPSEGFSDDDDSYAQTIQSDSMTMSPEEFSADDDDSYAQTIQSDAMSLDQSDDDSFGETMVSDDSFQTANFDSQDDDSNAATIQSADLANMTRDENSFNNTMANSELSPNQQKTMADAWGEDFEKDVSPGMTIKNDRTPTSVGSGDSKQTLVISTRKLSTRKIPDYNKGRRPPEPREPEYELLKVLGEGGMGVVFEATQRSIDREVAIKMLKPKTAKDKVQREKFLTEAVVTGELDHPNIVPIYDVGASPDDALFYSMKKVQGTPWLDVVKEKSCVENLEILMRSCDAVAFAHARGVIHRDLKPENIMLGGYGEVLVMDWGLAYSTEEFRKSASITESTSMGGTPAYMAPEMATGPIQKIGEHSDVYLFGAILFEIITSKPPHAGKNAMKCLMAAARNTIRPVDEEKLAINDPTGELLEIAMKAMATEIPERTSTVKEFQAQIREYQLHTDSVKLSARGIEDLKVAKKTDDYQDFSKALFGFQEAYAMWKGNDAAKEGIQETKLAYALSAERKGDFNQGMSLLDVGNAEQKEIFTRMKLANDEREARQARIQKMKKIAVIAAGVFLFTVSGAAFWINSERSKAVAAEKEAVIQKDKAVAQEKIAVKAKEEVEEQKKEVEIQKDAAVIAKNAAVKAKDEAEKAQKAEAKAKEDAVRAKDEAVAEKEKAEKAQKAEAAAKVAAIMAREKAEAAQKAEAAAKVAAITAKEKAETAQKAEAKAKEDAVKAKDEAIVAKNDAVKAKVAAEKAQKAEAAAKVAAVKAKDEAVVAKNEAVKAKDAAEKAQKAEAAAKVAAIAEKEKAEKAQKAEAAAKVAAIAEKEKAEKAQKAEAIAKVAAEKARDAAVKAKEQEIKQAYIARIGLADARIRENAFSAAETILKECPSELQDWEWGRLMHLCKQSRLEFKNADGDDTKSIRVDSLGISNDGTLIATGGGEGKAFIRDRRGNVVFKLPRQGNKVYSVAWSPDGKLLATGSDDEQNGFIQLWNVETKKRIPITFDSAHSKAVLSVEFSPNGKHLVSSSFDQTARIWDVASGKLIKSLAGHTYWVWDATYSPDGKSIATCSEDGTAIVWDLEKNYRKSAPFTGHKGAVYTIAFAPNGKEIASGGRDRRVLIWKPNDVAEYRFDNLKSESGKVVAPSVFEALDGHAGPVRTLRFTKTGEFLISGSDDNSIKQWSLENKRIQKTFRGHDSSVRAVSLADEDTTIISASHDTTIKQWSIAEYEEIRILQNRVLSGHSDSVLSARFSPNGETIVTASRDRTARLWSSKNGAVTHELSEGHSFLASSVAYFPGGQLMATAAGDNTLRIWDVNSSTQVAVLRNTGTAAAFAISSDGKTIVTGGKNSVVQVWDIEKSDSPKLVLRGHNREVTAVAISTDTQWIATGDSFGRVKLWNAKTGKLQFEMNNHSKKITDAVFLADGSRLLTSSTDKSVAQWDTKTGKEINHPDQPRRPLFVGTDGIESIALRSKDRQVVAGSSDGWVRVVDIDTAKVLSSFEMPPGKNGPLAVKTVALSPNQEWAIALNSERQIAVCSLDESGVIQRQRTIDHPGPLWSATFTPQGTGLLTVGGSDATIIDLEGNIDTSFTPHGIVASANFSTDGKRVVTGSWDKSARIWDAATGKAIRKLINGHNGRVLSASFSPDPESKFILTSDSEGKVVIWEHATGKIVREIEAHPGFSVKHAIFSPDGKSILTASGDKTARLWAVNSGDEIQRFEGHGSEVFAGAFSKDGQSIITGSEDDTARVWDAKTGKELFLLKGHTGDVNAVAFAPTTKQRAVTASQDGSVKVWDLNETTTDEESQKEDTKEILTLDGHTREVTSVVFSPNGRYILTGSEDGKAIIWLTQEWNKAEEKVAKAK